MIQNLLILGVMVSAILAWTYFSNTQERVLSENIQPVKNFAFHDLSNKKHTLYDYKGRHVILHFWATWCAPCVEELPELIELSQKRDNDLTIIAIAVADKPKDIKKFLSQTKKRTADNFIVGLDPDKTISKEIYNTIKLPESYILTPALTLKEKIAGTYNGWKGYP